ncbi:MAG: RNA methyltransferase [Syntrophobacterales bacterium]|jgi:23S rRNA (guanosine2251-2'-O)-methyltransferase|nr:RNA methyltransferase [Syntrophobacterales bacterium]
MPLLTDRNSILSTISDRPDTVRRLSVEKGYERLSDEIIKAAKKQGISFKVMPRELFARQFKGEKCHFCLETDEFSYTDQDVFLKGLKGLAAPLLSAFDGIWDPQNLGNIMRSAACFEVDALIAPKERSCGVTDTVARVAKGALSHVEFVRVTNLSRYLERIKESGVFCYGLDEAADRPLWEADLRGPVCLVFGRESGLRRLTREKCDEVFNIPTSPAFRSLNVATSFAAAVCEARRQRMTSPDGLNRRP